MKYLPEQIHEAIQEWIIETPKKGGVELAVLIFEADVPERQLMHARRQLSQLDEVLSRNDLNDLRDHADFECSSHFQQVQ